MSQLAHHYSRFQEAGIALAMLSTDSITRARQLAQEKGAPFPVLSDGDADTTVAYNLFEDGIALPATVLVDSAGRVGWHYVGQKPGDRPGPEAMLAAGSGLRTGRESRGRS
ncbi:MAG: hypothetical protein NVSMB65_16460 [Chloroflexota bacterium]